MPYAKAKDGCMLYYKDWGKGHPLALLHGWPLSGDSFDDAAVALVEAGHRCIIPDRRGFGRSDQPWDGYDYDTFADDLAAVLKMPASRSRSVWSVSRWEAEKSRAF